MTGLPTIERYALPSEGELPANTARWTVNPDRAVLLVHDMQQYFLAPFPAPVSRQLVANTALLRMRCAARGVQVAYTAQSGDMSEHQRGLLKDFWGPGMRSTAQDRQVVPELAPAESDWVFPKWRYSAFFRSGLLRRMRESGRDQLVLCGVYAHLGVLITAVDAFTNDIQTFLVADAVADFSREYHDRALRYAAERCAVVVTAKEVLS
ncbi:isochorismatase family protein [Streptomyces sp. NBC_00829]|uniref:isochorismatase family protein n=1 Tax=Streptomyces sp. NBC_00829 TaxID=2903679 RepID=UPI00386F33C2|nr:isochorismatase family protein [Streptomyces sp. NBC_00829]